MLLIVGLGNPGGQYALNRHNIGFMAADAIHRRHGFGPWRSRFSAEIAEGTLAGRKVLLMKPQTYMNDSGRAVADASRFLKIPNADIVVIHDELDLPPGKTRMKIGGGHGGHNGLRSISAHIGEDYRRLRVGIGHPGAKELVHAHVLHDFARVDAEWINPLLDAIADAAPLLADGKDNSFANRLHRIGEAEKPARPVRKAEAVPSEAARQPDQPAPDTPPDGPFAAGLKRLFGKNG
ncbi:aminoacyl-tRNA hydrolase [Kaistia algarum]|uniref:aminoacyl-tRNA hydrolase n=1 Tax=Kaistia algarum TaxID=2083279 RepID=UPI000CE7E664|nr:aminoacyl-tRNA hydrolase [Kaistia algarum]MCX5515629.1 aminoacyl-tRNA hydrolase [Kaistia algarum]PPE80982.1 aminoacyl-tRNA hydrolase [Kaistia algarum]